VDRLATLRSLVTVPASYPASWALQCRGRAWRSRQRRCRTTRHCMCEAPERAPAPPAGWALRCRRRAWRSGTRRRCWTRRRSGRAMPRSSTWPACCCPVRRMCGSPPGTAALPGACAVLPARTRSCGARRGALPAAGNLHRGGCQVGAACEREAAGSLRQRMRACPCRAGDGRLS